LHRCPDERDWQSIETDEEATVGKAGSRVIDRWRSICTTCELPDLEPHDLPVRFETGTPPRRNRLDQTDPSTRRGSDIVVPDARQHGGSVAHFEAHSARGRNAPEFDVRTGVEDDVGHEFTHQQLAVVDETIETALAQYVPGKRTSLRHTPGLARQLYSVLGE
jgi:hypothetical protein